MACYEDLGPRQRRILDDVFRELGDAVSVADARLTLEARCDGDRWPAAPHLRPVVFAVRHATWRTYVYGVAVDLVAWPLFRCCSRARASSSSRRSRCFRDKGARWNCRCDICRGSLKSWGASCRGSGAEGGRRSATGRTRTRGCAPTRGRRSCTCARSPLTGRASCRWTLRRGWTRDSPNITSATGRS